ncbi:MAG: zinc-dependent metalloprotease, partial [Candidatus Dormibacteraeota bacterium]|nr:zinc-dependent metalloprotease [Candidatus Dormibacteraeota bacterium]
HELTHAWQFAAHPWLRDHLNDQLRQLVALAVGAREGEPARPPSIGSLFTMATGVPGQLALVRKVQATMSLVEGYGNLVMTLVGRRALPGFDSLEEAYRRRSGQRSPLELLLWRVTGLELKLQQYRVGEAFSQAVYDRYGMANLNRAWENPDSIPRPEELRDPDRWYRRVVQGGEPGAQLRPAPA